MLFEPLDHGVGINRLLGFDMLIASDQAGFERGLDLDQQVAVAR